VRFTAETEEELPDFPECETQLTRALDEGEPVEHGSVVAPASTDALAGKQHANLFVITNGRGLQSNLTRHLGDCQLQHGLILGAGRPDCHPEVTNSLQNTAFLKVDFKL